MSTPLPPQAAPPPPGAGALRVLVDTPSHLFNRTVAVEIRDESMALVQRIESGREVALPPGLYQVSAVLQDGMECRRIVNVVARGAQAQSVTLAVAVPAAAQPVAAAETPAAAGAAPDEADMAASSQPEPEPEPVPVGAAPPSAAAPLPAPVPAPPRTGGMRVASAPKVRLPHGFPKSDSVTLSAEAPPQGSMVSRLFKRLASVVQGAPVPPPDARAGRAAPAIGAAPEAAATAPPDAVRDARAQPPGPQPSPRAAPHGDGIELVALHGAAVSRGAAGEWRLHGTTASDTVANATVRVGAAQWRISLPVQPGDGHCLLRVDPANARVPVTAWIAPERTMVAALQNMLLNGEYAALVPVAEQAIELLRSKYQDPTGAALGALILHKVGGLAPYAPWLENLARDFPWIPDGDVLLASLLVQDHQQLDRALQLALSAAGRRVLHAETYSILLDMLRRWPDRAAMAAHRDVVEAVARKGAYVAWGSLYFCHAFRE